MDSTDVILIKKCKKQDKKALNELYKRHQAYVYRLCYGYTNKKEDALDLVQEIFIKVLKNLKTFDENRPFLPWLKKITVTTCLNFKRDSKTAVSLDQVMTDRGETLKDALASQFNLENFVVFQETSQIVRRCINRIEEKYRMPLILRHQEDMTYEEISQALDLPLGTLKIHLYRGRKKLRNLLTEEGIWGMPNV